MMSLNHQMVLILFQVFKVISNILYKKHEKLTFLEVVEVVLVQFNSVDNQYQQKSEVLYTFTQNKSYAYLLNVEPSHLVFLKTCNTEFDQIIITFTGQNGRPLEIEDKVNWTLLINKQKLFIKWSIFC